MEQLFIKQNADTSERTLSYDIVLKDIVIGKCQLRTTARKSTALPEGFESHVYYEVDEEYQRHGYATSVLKLLLLEAKKVPFDKVLLSVLESNVPSIMVIEKNGGVLTKTDISTTGESYRLYEINTETVL